MNVFQYYWHRTACFASDVKTDTSQLCHWAVNKALSNETVNFQASQFIEGVKTVATFPFTSAKMIFHAPSRTLSAHVLQYNVLYYVLPVVAYNGFLREHAKTLLANTCGDYIFYLDLFANTVFARSLINAYAVNIFNNMNASSIELPYTPASVTLSCSCKESQHIKAAIMSPIYYLTKMAVLAPLEYIPYVGPVLSYTLKPLAWGEALNEVNLSSLCHDHRAKYFATHNAAHYGMGMAVMASTQIAGAAMTYYTGVSGFFIQDAIFNALYPFMIFHVHNQRFENVFLEDTPKDIFSPLRYKVEQGLNFGKSCITALPKSDNNLFGQIFRLTQKSKLRQMLFYSSLGQTPKQLVIFPPLHMLLKNNREAILEKLDTIEIVTNHPDLVANFLFFYQWLPLLPPKEHARIIVGIMTENIEITTSLLAHTKRLIAHVESHHQYPEHPVRVRIYSRQTPEDTLISSYIASSENKESNTKSSGKTEKEVLSDDFVHLQVESIDDDWQLIPSRSPSPTPSSSAIVPAFQKAQLRQRHLAREDSITILGPLPNIIHNYAPGTHTINSDTKSEFGL